MARGIVLDGDAAGLVRPYFRTHGRTRPTRELPVETLISTTEQGRAGVLRRSREESEICRLCSTSQSVAEVAAHRRIPLGVARVLLSDLADRGLVRVHTVRMSGSRPSLEIMKRILRGLRAL